ncbi:MAG: D-alanine--D-alanine ligase [Deltaproteobacteria bacterium]|nr:D-alanine--D-alanine ligase [Deltaproteobacteria bacterium]
MPSKRRLTVAVLFGGRSGEHEVSLRSALAVISAMDRQRYEAVPIAITRSGRWELCRGALSMLERAAPRLAGLGRAGIPVCLLPYPARGKLATVANGAVSLGRSSPGGAFPGRIDVAFVLVHGTYGEDGTLQGLLELSALPYVGAGVLGSAVGMDKDVQKRLLREAGIPVVPYRALTRDQHRRDSALCARHGAELGYPVYVKPNGLGSSIGVSRVASARGLGRAVAEAFRYDLKVLLEAACEGREIECAVLGNREPQASVPGEIVLGRGRAFYSYASKYLAPAGATTRIPAALTPRQTARVRELAVAAFRALELRGMARVDFLAAPDLSRLFVSEVNTIPGFTPISMYPKLWQASGLPLERLIDRLIQLALEEHRERAQRSFVYLGRNRPRAGSR